METQPAQGPDFAGRLNTLYALNRRADGTEYTNEYVATTITQQYGVRISPSYIWQLRKGLKDNPSARHLHGIASFFQVPVQYFFDDAVTDRVNEKLKQLQAETARLEQLTHDSGPQLIALRAGELSPSRLQLVMDLVNVVYREEQAERGEGEE